MKITAVSKLDNGYKINDAVIITNLSPRNDEEITYDMSWDEEKISEDEAEILTRKFISEAMRIS